MFTVWVQAIWGFVLPSAGANLFFEQVNQDNNSYMVKELLQVLFHNKNLQKGCLMFAYVYPNWDNNALCRQYSMHVMTSYV